MDELVSVCAEASAYLAENPLEGSILKRLKKDARLRELSRKIEAGLDAVGEVYSAPSVPKPSSERLLAVTWNIERGKNFEGVLTTLKTHPDLREADILFLTEVDWGMARSGNRNVAADLARELGLYAYFAPSYFNFTNGHGSERGITGNNKIGLHGKAILSRYPLRGLQAAPMPNATNKLISKEARLGQKRSLIGHLDMGHRKLALACIHLDAFSSPKARARQIQKAVLPLLNGNSSLPSLIAGDWNTNTINSSSGRSVLLSVMKQLVFTGPKKMITQHHRHPEKKYDRPVFKTLSDLGFDYVSFNEIGVGTYDLVNNDMNVGQMAMDQFPKWVLEWINRLIIRSGGLVSLKLDWFAGRGLEILDKKVVRLTPQKDCVSSGKPSDHFPVRVTLRRPQ